MCPEAHRRVSGVAISPRPDTANLNRGSSTISALGAFVKRAFCNSPLIGFKYGLFSIGTAAVPCDPFQADVFVRFWAEIEKYLNALNILGLLFIFYFTAPCL